MFIWDETKLFKYPLCTIWKTTKYSMNAMDFIKAGMIWTSRSSQNFHACNGLKLLNYQQNAVEQIFFTIIRPQARQCSGCPVLKCSLEVLKLRTDLYIIKQAFYIFWKYAMTLLHLFLKKPVFKTSRPNNLQPNCHGWATPLHNDAVILFECYRHTFAEMSSKQLPYMIIRLEWRW